jgi:hypothetical protein
MALVEALVFGCVPVIIQQADDVDLPFASLLPYDQFTLKVPLSRLMDGTHDLSEMLSRARLRLPKMQVQGLGFLGFGGFMVWNVRV